MKRIKWLKIIIFLIIFIIFIYFRITPIINKTVPYTYDQGRDFLKVEEIFRDKNITFIGPTTGIQGVYHGVWWYYFLTIPYLIFSGWPQGFYLFLFSFNLLINIGFFKFLVKNFSFSSGLFFLSIVSVSTFFIRTAFFASNNILAPLFIPLLICFLYQNFETDKKIYLVLTGLTLGFILETEFAFGLFIIPSFLIVYFLFKRLKNLFFLFSGLFIPTIPRILFELRNNFAQTRSFFEYLTLNKNEHPIQIKGLFIERLTTFWQAWKSIFYQENTILAVLSTLLLVFIIIFRKKLQITKKEVTFFSIILLFFIFLISLLNKNNFFWSYYIDGVQYLFLFLIITGFYLLEKEKKTFFISRIVLIMVLLLNFFVFIKEISSQTPIPLIGLRADDKIIKYIIEKNKDKNFCLNIYTPPIFPFTYRYLLDYYTKKDSSQFIKIQPIDNQCWYIIDYDDNQERIANWKKINMPMNGKLIETKKFENKTTVELWQETL